MFLINCSRFVIFLLVSFTMFYMSFPQPFTFSFSTLFSSFDACFKKYYQSLFYAETTASFSYDGNSSISYGSYSWFCLSKDFSSRSIFSASTSCFYFESALRLLLASAFTLWNLCLLPLTCFGVRIISLKCLIWMFYFYCQIKIFKRYQFSSKVKKSPQVF